MTARPLLVGLGWLDAPGGLERYVAELRRELDDPPTVVLSALPQPAPGVLVAARADDRLLRRLWRIRRTAAVAAGAADVVDLHFALTGAAALSSAAVRRLPKVVHFHGPWADEAGNAHRLRRRIERAVYRSAERFVVLSGAMARVLIERYGVEPWRVSVLPPGVDLHHFCPGDRSEARRRWGVDDGAFVAVAVRRLVPRTGLGVLLDAWTRAGPRLPAGATLLVAGDGPQRAELEEQARHLAGSADVRLLGRVDDRSLLDLYRAADLVVMPSVSLEGFGLVALEALACGTPTLVTRCGGLPDAVAGLGLPLVEPGDAPALADALVAAATGERIDPARCRAHAERFTWPTTAARHRALYAAATTRQPPTGLRVVLVDHSAARSGGEIAMARLVAASPATRFHAVLFEEGPFGGLLSRAGATAEVRALGAARGVDRARATHPSTVLRHSGRVALHAIALAWRLHRLRPDVVHANSLKAGLVGGVAARLAGVPMVWHLRDRLAEDYLPPRSARLVRVATRHLAVAVVAPSAAVLDTLGRPGRRAQERVVLADPYPSGPPRPPRPAGKPLQVTMVGRLAPWKGQDVFLAAFAQAFPAGDERATIVGAALFGSAEQTYADGLRSLVADLGMTARVAFVGARDDVPVWLADADIVVHASRTPEPFGQVVVEAMAAGAAVIATDGGGPSELIRTGVDGVLVPPGDVAALATALRELGGEPDRRARLGRSAQARVAERTDPERIGRAMAAVHERAARNRRRRRAR